MPQTIRVHSWRVEVYLDGGAAKPTITYFATEGLARLAVEWAYTVRRAEVAALPEAHQVETYQPGAGSSNPWARKLSWWRKTPNGFVAVKEYFDATEESFERTVIE